MKIAELLKLKAAAKAYLGGLAVAAQIALTYLPDHSGYYNFVQVLLGVLGVIGIFAIPNKVSEAKDAVDQAKKFASTIVVNAASGVDPQKIASELAWQLSGGAPAPANPAVAAGLKAVAAAADAGAAGIQVLRDAADVAAPVAPVETPPVTDTPAPVADPAQAAPAPAATPIQKDTPAP